MDRSYQTQMNSGPLTIERQYDTLQPVNDPEYKGLFVVTTYEAYCRVFQRVVVKNGTTPPNGKPPQQR